MVRAKHKAVNLPGLLGQMARLARIARRARPQLLRSCSCNATLSRPCSQRVLAAVDTPLWQEPQLSTSKERPLKYHFAISNPPRTLDPCHRATNTSAPVHTQDSGALFDFNQPTWRDRLTAGGAGWGSAESCWGVHKGRREADRKGVENLQKRETEAQHLPRSWTPRPL